MGKRTLRASFSAPILTPKNFSIQKSIISVSTFSTRCMKLTVQLHIRFCRRTFIDLQHVPTIERPYIFKIIIVNRMSQDNNTNTAVPRILCPINEFDLSHYNPMTTKQSTVGFIKKFCQYIMTLFHRNKHIFSTTSEKDIILDQSYVTPIGKTRKARYE